ncbi:putative UDP-glucose glucosyltransferase [Phalaenopsis equestris]|uniref:putative UDP-glucose glucosyltransferase n=1 Tax=Phalaenopsis equestris TaxID=78828 RepID=UPI0009E44EFC|nr:putative UDP-glucose glucosyltransferase [Phalaenopsis equestris]
MGEANPLLHFLFVSFPGQGHVNPLLRLAKRVAAKGLLVTFTTTIEFGSRIRAASQLIFPTESDSDLIPVGLGFLRFEFFNDGADPKNSIKDLSYLMTNLETNGPSALVDLIRRQSAAGRPVSCLVNNPFIPWALDVAAELSIPSAVLWIQSCAVFSIYYHFHHRLANFPTDKTLKTLVQLPGIPPIAPDELPTFILQSNPYKSLTEAILAQFHNISKARWIFSNSFDELEHETLTVFAEISPIIPIGPLVDVGEELEQEEIKADLWKSADHCLDWLATQETNSVVYVSLGSVVMLPANEMAEFAYGLRNSGRPFLWVVREDVRGLLPEGFEKAMDVEGKAMIVGWSPQQKVLASKAVGCFVTHCGWNSSLEAITAGVPIVAYPQWGDQVTNAKFLCDVYGIGVRLTAPATRETVENCVAVAVDGEEAARMRNKAETMREMARKAIAVNGSSDRSIEIFIDDVRKRVAGDGQSSVD